MTFMIRQLQSFNAAHNRVTDHFCLALAGAERGMAHGRAAVAGSKAAAALPRRPDDTVLNQEIPLFYIGRNRAGLWVVRSADGGTGGLFLFKSAAARFAREESEPGGCALMYLTEPLELDGGVGAMRPGAAASAAAAPATALRSRLFAMIESLLPRMRAIFAGYLPMSNW
jgi:hypothetical protein